MRNTIIANIQTFAEIQSWAIGEKLLQQVFGNQKLTPQRAATFGEVTAKHGFDVERLEDCRSHWGTKATMQISGVQREVFEGFSWKRSRVARSKGVVTFPSTNMKGVRLPGGLYFEAQYKSEIDWVDLFTSWCSVLSPYGAMLHPVIEYEQPNAAKRSAQKQTIDEEIAQIAWSRFATGNFHCEFRAGELNSSITGLTNLGWATFFGGQFAEEVDATALSGAGFPVQKIGDGYMVQVTEDINDVVNDFTVFSKRRAELKSLFRDGLFLIKDEPAI